MIKYDGFVVICKDKKKRGGDDCLLGYNLSLIDDFTDGY